MLRCKLQGWSNRIMKKEKTTQVLRGRFEKDMAAGTAAFVASIGIDRRLYRYDIIGSIAHVEMLAEQGIITERESEMIASGLISILEEIENGRFMFCIEHEDIHMAIERRLFEKIGDVAGKLHTARSRNDQVALDMRLCMKDTIVETVEKLKRLQSAIVAIAAENKKVVMPGYTHLQQAQPVLFAHHMLAYFEMFQRDKGRFQDCYQRVDVMPLGSGALAGVPYNIDRFSVAEKLGFGTISDNSIDAVSDRDFLIEYEAAAALTMMHLSRFAEELILWSSAEFGFITLDDSYTTSSSIMPQKKNPDVAELVRGKTGKVYGSLVSLLTVMKSLPLAYNRDMQEDKEGLFTVIDTLFTCLDVFAGMIRTMSVNGIRMGKAMDGGYILATDIADYLVKKGLPFREAHTVTGKLVNYADRNDKRFGQMKLSEYRKFSNIFADDVFSITMEGALASRNTIGGTAPLQVSKALARARRMAAK